MTRARFSVVVLILAVSGRAAADSSPSIQLSLDSDRVYEGQPVGCSVSVVNLPHAGRPQFKQSSDYEITPIGRPADRSSMTIIQGRRTSSSERVYQYRLIPRRTGDLIIAGPTVTADGQEMRADDKPLAVLPAASQDFVRLEILSDRTSLYPMQEMTLTLRVSVKELPAPFSEYEPVAVQNVPRLVIPWLDRQQLATGIQHSGNPEEWLTRIRSRHGTGFRVNDIGVDSFFSLFGSRATSFHPDPGTVMLPDKDGIARRYWQYEFSQKFRAVKPGRYAFGPASLSGTFGVSVNDRESLEMQEIYALAPPPSIEVHEIPQQGRPAAYVGAVGSFRATAELSPRRVQVRDPMTLTVTLEGEGTLEAIRPPDLLSIPAVAQHFMIYEAEQKSGENRTSFVYELRPLDAGIEEFPSIPLAYFDSDQEKYVVLQTEPIKIEVAGADRLTAGQIVAPPASAPSRRGELEASHEGIFANIADLSAVHDESIVAGRWFAGLGGMAAAYAALAGLASVVRRRSEDPVLVRRRGAPARSRRRLREAQAEWSAGRVVEGADAAHDALVGLVADSANVPEPGMTGKDVRDYLSEFGIDGDLIDRAVSLLDARDAARYGDSYRDPAQWSRQWQEVIEELIRSLSVARRFR